MEHEPQNELEIGQAITHAYSVGKRLLRHKGKKLVMYIVLEKNVIVPEWLAKDLEDHYDIYNRIMGRDHVLTDALKEWVRQWTEQRDLLLEKMEKENIAK